MVSSAPKEESPWHWQEHSGLYVRPQHRQTLKPDQIHNRRNNAAVVNNETQDLTDYDITKKIKFLI